MFEGDYRMKHSILKNGGTVMNVNLGKVLITCDDDNIASKRIIENNGGIFESQILKEENQKQLRRYWIALGV